jgi:hypothetical protein
MRQDANSVRRLSYLTVILGEGGSRNASGCESQSMTRSMRFHAILQETVTEAFTFGCSNATSMRDGIIELLSHNEGRTRSRDGG